MNMISTNLKTVPFTLDITRIKLSWEGRILLIFVASRGNIQSVGLSYTHYPRNIDYIDYIVPYLDYSKINKDGETNGQYFFLQSPGFDYKDSEQISFGSIIGMGNMIIYMDLLFGKGAPMIGNNNSSISLGPL